MVIDVVCIVVLALVFIVSAMIFIDVEKWMTIARTISRQEPDRPSAEHRVVAVLIMAITAYMMSIIALKLRQ
jgi:hypothetical protein